MNKKREKEIKKACTTLQEILSIDNIALQSKGDYKKTIKRYDHACETLQKNEHYINNLSSAIVAINKKLVCYDATLPDLFCYRKNIIEEKINLRIRELSYTVKQLKIGIPVFMMISMINAVLMWMTIQIEPDEVRKRQQTLGLQFFCVPVGCILFDFYTSMSQAKRNIEEANEKKYFLYKKIDMKPSPSLCH